MAPDTIVAAVAAKTAWNNQSAKFDVSVELISLRMKPSVPRNPQAEVPNIRPYPTQK